MSWRCKRHRAATIPTRIRIWLWPTLLALTFARLTHSWMNCYGATPKDTLLKEFTVPEVHALDAINKRDGAVAIAALQGSRSYDLAFPFILPYVRGMANLAAHQPQQAAAEFQVIADHPGVMPTFPSHSLAHLGLARAYAMAGDAAKARTAYQDFFSLW